jgi:type III secretory pathway component EscV
MIAPWGIEVGADLAALAAPADDEGRLTLHGATRAMREAVFLELGVPLPPGRIAVNPSLAPRAARIDVREIPARTIEVPAGAEDAASIAQAATDVLTRRAADFVGIGEAQRLLDDLDLVSPAVVRSVVPKPISVTLLADVLRRLVAERVSIRDLGAILEALATFTGGDRDAQALCEHVRASLRRAITFRLTGGSDAIDVYLLDETVEGAIRSGIVRQAQGPALALPPAQARDLVASVRRAVAKGGSTARAGAVLLATPDVRPFVRSLIAVDLPDVHVVAFPELLPEVTLRPLGKATLAEG